MASIATRLALVVALICITEAFNLGHSRQRRAITPIGLTAREELALTDSQKTALEKLKSAVLSKINCPNMKKDIYLVKFLRAQDYDADRAITQVEAALTWRQANKIDEISKEDLSKARGLFEASTVPEDVQNRPIIYIQAGKWGLKGALEAKMGESYERTFYQLFEEAVEKTIKNYEAGKKNAQFILGMNYDEWTTEQGACVDCVGLVSKLGINFDGKWPGFAHKIILVNTAPDFHLFLDLIRPVLTKETNEKLEVFGRKKEEWCPEVLKLVTSCPSINKYCGK